MKDKPIVVIAGDPGRSLAVVQAMELLGKQAELIMIDDSNFRLEPEPRPKLNVEELSKLMTPVVEPPPPKRVGAFYETLYDKRGRRRV